MDSTRPESVCVKKVKAKSAAYKPNYTIWDEMMASADQPLPVEKRTYQLSRMYEGLHALETAEKPTRDDWRCVSDTVNLIETLVLEMGVCEDSDGLLDDAVQALAIAGNRHIKTGAPIRLDGKGIQAVRSILKDYADLLEVLPARTMIRCHRLTEKRIHGILTGKKKPHDVEIVNVG
jgi:hypothetical protein